MERTKVVLAIASACLAGIAAVPETGHAEYLDTLEYGITAGYRVDELDWNIADTDGAPNILSELSWKDLDIYQVGASGKLAVGNEDVDFLTYIRGHFNYGWVKDGNWQDSDFHGDNRTIEYSRSIGLAEDDNVLDASIGLGFQWKTPGKHFAIAPLGGYSYHEQNVRLTQGIQVIPADGPFAGLDSTYEAEWQGPWAGVDLEWTPTRRFSLFGAFEYHWADYEAEADWNLRDNLAHPVSYEHDVDDAHGIILKATGRYLFAGSWALDLSYDYQEWQAEDGTDTTFSAIGTSTDTKLNEVNWKSHAVTLGLTYKFY